MRARGRSNRAFMSESTATSCGSGAALVGVWADAGDWTVAQPLAVTASGAERRRERSGRASVRMARRCGVRWRRGSTG